MSSLRHRDLLLFVMTLLIAGQGSALARPKKKHRAAPAHHRAPAKAPESGESSAEPDSGDEQSTAGAKSVPDQAPERSGEGEAASSGETAAEEEVQQPPPTKHRSPKPAAPAEPSGDERRLPPALQAGIRLGALYRNLSWTQVSSGTLDPFSVSPGMQAGLRVEFYPAALVGRDVGSNFGAVLAFDRGFGITAKGPYGDVSGIFQDFLLAFKVRFPIGLLVPYASIGYGGQAFLFAPPRLMAVPSVFYTFVHLAAGARIQITDAIDLDVGAAYLPVIDAGKQAGYVQSSDYFPTMSSHALEASGSLGLRISRLLGLRAGVDFRQYALDTSNAGGMFTAQGATDRYLSPWLMIEIVVDGAGPLGGGPED